MLKGSYKSQQRPSGYSISGLLLASLLLGVMSGCERDMTIQIDGQNPPTFELDGNGELVFLLVTEVQPDNPRPSGNPRLWEIRPTEVKKIWELPSITYGVIPEGFRQVIPESGSPPPLVEGKTYSLGGPADNANGGSIWFTIRNGKSVRVPKRDGTLEPD